MTVLWLILAQVVQARAWPGMLVVVAGTVLVGVVGRLVWVGHLNSEDERLLMILFTEPGMPADHFRASAGLVPDEYALAVHRLKEGWWIEWRWGAYHLTPRARARLEAKMAPPSEPRPTAKLPCPPG